MAKTCLFPDYLVARLRCPGKALQKIIFRGHIALSLLLVCYDIQYQQACARTLCLAIYYLFHLKLGIKAIIRVFYQRFSSVVFIRMHLAFNPFQLANQSIAKIDLTDIFHCFCLVFAALRNIIITYIS